MKTMHLLAIGTLLSLTAACAARTEPTADTDQRATGSANPGAACTALPTPNGSVNPAAAYCAALGYTSNASSQCVFPDGSACDEWAFYRGTCGGARSFCALHGGAVSSVTEDMGTWTAAYAVCTLPDGSSCHEDDYAHSCVCGGGPSQPDAGPGPGPDAGPAPDGGPAPACAPLAPSNGSANPAAVYCVELGYSNVNGDCVFPDGTSCEEWSFYRGACGQTHSFCELHGGAESSRTENMGSWTATYAVCTLPTGQECHEDSFSTTCSCP